MKYFNKEAAGKARKCKSVMQPKLQYPAPPVWLKSASAFVAIGN